ncbi:MAG TPA: hypothetical protein VG367_19080 [Mucilaginibacter sp.]|jgi:hypothetical protein|nr:hypothetical protein [Mucilaginibacter sp.]
MDAKFINYQKFNDIALANELIDVLEKHGIPYQTEEQTSGFDASLVMSNAPVDYAVKIKSEDFEKVNQIVRENEAAHIDETDKDYYLFTFTDAELKEVIIKADEWSAFDVVLARKILTERGIDISDRELEEIHEKRIEDLKTPEKSSALWIVIGYICALGGGILGIFIGWYLATGKKTLPDGEKVYTYSNKDRVHGRIIFYLSIPFLILAILYRLRIITPEG